MAETAACPQTAGYPTDCILRPRSSGVTLVHSMIQCLAMGRHVSMDRRLSLPQHHQQAAAFGDLPSCQRRPTSQVANCPKKRMPRVLCQELAGAVTIQNLDKFPSASCFPIRCSKCHHCSLVDPRSSNLRSVSNLPATMSPTMPSLSRARCSNGSGSQSA